MSNRRGQMRHQLVPCLRSVLSPDVVQKPLDQQMLNDAQAPGSLLSRHPLARTMHPLTAIRLSPVAAPSTPCRMDEQLFTRTRRQSLSRFVCLVVHFDAIHAGPVAMDHRMHSGAPAELVSFREHKGEEHAKSDVQVLTTAISYPSGIVGRTYFREIKGCAYDGRSVRTEPQSYRRLLDGNSIREPSAWFPDQRKPDTGYDLPGLMSIQLFSAA